MQKVEGLHKASTAAQYLKIPEKYSTNESRLTFIVIHDAKKSDTKKSKLVGIPKKAGDILYFIVENRSPPIAQIRETHPSRLFEEAEKR